MPTPKNNESKNDFIPRCISYVSKEKPDWEQDKVSAYCYSIWREKSSSSEKAAYAGEKVARA